MFSGFEDDYYCYFSLLQQTQEVQRGLCSSQGVLWQHQTECWTLAGYGATLSELSAFVHPLALIDAYVFVQ